MINSYQDTYSFDDPQVFSLSLDKSGYIKWFTPCRDYPCLLDTYCLFPPFCLDSNSHYLKAAGEKGEREEILWTVKYQLGQIAKDIL